MRTLLICAVMSLVGLAGCAENDDPQEAAPTGSTGDPTGGVNVTDLPPVANVTADVLNGTAPLDVLLVLNGTDPEGANLTWTLSINGTEAANGSALPAEFAATFGPGNHTVHLRISDGNLTSNASLQIRVQAPVEDSEFPVVLSGDVDFACGTVEGCYILGAEGCLGWLAADQGIDCVWFPLPAHYEDREFETESDGDVDVDFRSDCSRTGESIDVFGADGQETGNVPAGARCAVLMDYTDGGTLSITIS